MRAACLAFGVVAGLWVGMASAAEAPRQSASPAFAAQLRAIFVVGLNRQNSFSEIQTHVAKARSLNSQSPAVDYAFGLVMLKRLEIDRAADGFQAALAIDPTYMPARRALIRLRLMRKDAKTLLTEVAEFAGAIANTSAPWESDESRTAAAEYLGRVIGFLARPETRLTLPDALQTAEVDVENRLGTNYIDAYLRGVEQLSRDFEALTVDDVDEADKRTDRKHREATAKIERLKGRSEEAGRAAESLALSKEELKTKFEAELKDLDKQLATLEKEYSALSESAKRAEDMMIQTRTDISRLQTELDLRGIRGREARLQPPLVQLQQELNQQQERYSDLEQRAAELLETARQLTVAREAASEQYRAQTGELARRSDSVEKWNKALEKNSKKTKETVEAGSPARQVKKNLSSPNNFFPLDIPAEADRLLVEHGTRLTIGKNSSTAKKTPVRSGNQRAALP